ncbi:MAG: lysoplasmalogenase family protein [Candidatus Izemoplasmatales bacterium]
MIYALIIAFLVIWSLFIYNKIRNNKLQSFYLKGLTSYMFILIFGYGFFHYIVKQDLLGDNVLLRVDNLKIIILIGIGLVLGLIGDLFLEVQYFYPNRKTLQIRYGMLVFLIGHCFYIAALSISIGFNYWSLLVGIIMVVIIYFGSKLMNINFKNLAAMTYIYTLVIFTMVGMSVFQAIELGFNNQSTLFFIGALLFGISDLVLAPIYFQNQTGKFFTIANLSTYYFGQALIALSIMFI